MRPRIAIPLPHGGDPAYALRAVPQYERAIELSGGEPVRVPLDRSPEEVMKLIERCDAVVLPGSKADVDPAKYDAPPHPKTEAADPLRDMVDELLLQDAYNMRKPVLAICYGLQILNVYRSGNLLQHIESPVNHEAGRKVPVAHQVTIDPDSKLAEIIGQVEPMLARANAVPQRAEDQSRGDDVWVARQVNAGETSDNIRVPKATARSADQEHPGRTRMDDHPHTGTAGALVIPVNSSHHQAAGNIIGDGVKIVARCPSDNIIEALEGTSPDHLVLAVQWHPERSFDEDVRSRAIFAALVQAARQRHGELIGEFEAT